MGNWHTKVASISNVCTYNKTMWADDLPETNMWNWPLSVPIEHFC